MEDTGTTEEDNDIGSQDSNILIDQTMPALFTSQPGWTGGCRNRVEGGCSGFDNSARKVLLKFYYFIHKKKELLWF